MGKSEMIFRRVADLILPKEWVQVWRDEMLKDKWNWYQDRRVDWSDKVEANFEEKWAGLVKLFLDSD